MGKITGMEPVQETPPKVLLLYEAVLKLIGEGADLGEMRVSSITEYAGIGKGTAYDYFDSKEEMMACAFLHYMTRVAERTREVLLPLDNLRTQINCIFDYLEHESGRKFCFVRFVHAATDNSKFSQQIREKLKGSDVGVYFPEYLFGCIIDQGVERGEINAELPRDYLVYTIFCKVMTYVMGVCMEQCFRTEARAFRGLIIEGILRDVQG